MVVLTSNNPVMYAILFFILRFALRYNFFVQPHFI
nr:MAG TPA: hypothetical protein [Caudoviricetes sp.]